MSQNDPPTTKAPRGGLATESTVLARLSDASTSFDLDLQDGTTDEQATTAVTSNWLLDGDWSSRDGPRGRDDVVVILQGPVKSRISSRGLHAV